MAIQSITFNGRSDVKKVTINGGVYWEKQSADHATMTVKMTSGVVPTYTGWTASLVSAAADGDVYTLTKDDTAKPTSYDFYSKMAEKNDLLEAEINVDENVTSLKYCFRGCSKLTSINTSAWNTSNVTDMQYLFYTCSSITDIDLLNFDTSKVTTFDYMFFNCTKLTSVNVSGTNWNTGNVTNMKSMFYGCSTLTQLDLSNFDTSKVTTFDSMFFNCTKLTSVNVSGTNWNTGNVTNMKSVFNKCSALETLDLSDWDTQKVTNTTSMFVYCSKITELTVSPNFFKTNQVINLAYMSSLLETSFATFANNAKSAYDAGFAGKGDGSVTEHREVTLSSTQRTWAECAILESADYTIS